MWGSHYRIGLFSLLSNTKTRKQLNQIYRERGTFLLYIYFPCLGVCWYPINVKTAEPIGPKVFAGPRVKPGKVYGWSKFQKFVSDKIQYLKILKIHNIFYKIRKFFVLLLFYNVYKEKMFTIEIEDGREAL